MIVPDKNTILMNVYSLMNQIKECVEYHSRDDDGKTMCDLYKKMVSMENGNENLSFKDGFGSLITDLQLNIMALKNHPEYNGIPNHVISLDLALKDFDASDCQNIEKTVFALKNVDFTDTAIKNPETKVQNIKKKSNFKM